MVGKPASKQAVEFVPDARPALNKARSTRPSDALDAFSLVVVQLDGCDAEPTGVVHGRECVLRVQRVLRLSHVRGPLVPLAPYHA